MKERLLFIACIVVFLSVIIYTGWRSSQANSWTLIVYPYGENTTVNDIILIPGPKSEDDCESLSVQHRLASPYSKYICTRECSVEKLPNGERNVSCKGIDIPNAVKKGLTK